MTNLMEQHVYSHCANKFNNDNNILMIIVNNSQIACNSSETILPESQYKQIIKIQKNCTTDVSKSIQKLDLKTFQETIIDEVYDNKNVKFITERILTPIMKPSTYYTDIDYIANDSFIYLMKIS